MDISDSYRPTDRDDVFTVAVQCVDNVASHNILPIPIHEAYWVFDKKEVKTEAIGRSSLKCLQDHLDVPSTRVNKLRANYTAIEKGLEISEKRKRLQDIRKRYLKSPEDLATLLNKTTQDLCEDIITLEQQLQHLRSFARPPEPVNDVWRTAAEYFRLVRHGLLLTSNQLGLMRDMMAVFNTEYGPEAIMQHWFFVDWFGDVDVGLKGWETIDGESLVAITTTSVTITKHTLRNVFPHLRTTDNSDRNDKIAERRDLHQRIVMHGTTG